MSSTIKNKKTAVAPPDFSEEKLKEILHYTDGDYNPAYDAFKSKSLIEIHSGAKGVSKSFGQAVITIYRLVNEKNFCSLWCRNQYNHITKTLKPTFEKVLSFLKNQHSLDFTPFFETYTSGLYWNYDDGGLGRCVLFENWESIQAFQGITLKNDNFLFGELVIDEPIEDPTDVTKQLHLLKQFYEIQKNKLPLLRANTIERLAAPDDFQIKLKFLYNIFTVEHFLIKDYHQKAIPLLLENGKINNVILDELNEKTFLQVEKPDFENVGLIVTMYHKKFVPEAQFSSLQRASAETLKKENYNRWLVTICGFAYLDETQENNYFLKNLIFDNDGFAFNKSINFANLEEVLKYRKILAVYDGFDPGLSDKASWCRVFLLDNGQIYVNNAIEDVKSLINSDRGFFRHNTNLMLLNLIGSFNNEIIEKWRDKLFFDYQNDLISLILTDNDIIRENLSRLIIEKKLNIATLAANRRDTSTQKFGIINRQEWQKWLLKNNAIIFNPSTAKLLLNLSKQYIKPGEDKRDESINPEIYDLINAFEMASSICYKMQNSLMLLWKEKENGRY